MNATACPIEETAELLFTESLRHLSAADIRRLATRMESLLLTPADEVAWWQANLAIERLTRTAPRAHSQRITAAGIRASRCVHDVAEGLGVPLPDTGVTRVARAAGQVARGLALGAPAAEPVEYLLDAWRIRYALEARFAGVDRFLREPAPLALDRRSSRPTSLGERGRSPCSRM